MNMKILGTAEKISSDDFEISQKVLWPCREYTVSIEGLNYFGDNILESVILQLFNEGEKDTGRLSYLTGLDAELVDFLASRLMQKNWLDQSGNLTEEGLAKFNLNAKPKKEFFHVYRDAVSGRMVPGLVFPVDATPYVQFSYRKMDYEKQEFEFSEASSAGTEKTQKEKIHVLSASKGTDAALDYDEVAALVHNSFAESQSNVFIPDGGDERDNLAYILIDVGIARGNSGKWLCSDGQNALSPFFTDALERISDRQFLADLRGKLQNVAIGGDEKASAGAPRFPEIHEKAKSVRNSLAEIDSTVPQSSDEKNRLESLLRTCVGDAYGLWEWALLHHLKDNIVLVNEIKPEIGQCRNKFEIKERTATAARKAGLRTQRGDGTDVEYLFLLDKGTFETAFSTPNLPPLLALEILVAERNGEFAFATIAREFPDLLLRIEDAKGFRDKVKHGAAAEIDKSYAKEFCEWTLSLVEKRLGFGGGTDGRGQSLAESINARNALNDSLIKLEADFGLALINSLPAEFSRNLREMESNCTGTSIKPKIVLDLYNLFGAAFLFLQQRVPNGGTPGGWKSKAKSCGFAVSTGKIIPLDGTNTRRIESALEKKPVSTQANCIAWICQTSEASLRNFATTFPNLLEAVAGISALRKHGEIPESGFTQTDLAEWKDTAVRFVKFLGSEGFFENNVNFD